MVIALILYFLGEISIGDELRELGVLSLPIFGFICGFLSAFCHDD